MYDKITFKTTDGTVLAGRHYRADRGGEPTPLIVVSGGFSDVIEMRAWCFAEAFCKAGFSVLAYDHRGFGESGGPIRQEVDPNQQLSDARDAITFGMSLPGVDSKRIGIWGSSYSGGHVLVLAATDRRIGCVVSQVPFISGSRQTMRNVRADFAPMMQQMFAADRAARMAGAEPMTLPVVTPDPTQPAALPSQEAWQWTIRYQDGAPQWKNVVTLRSIELAGTYEPGGYVACISPTPLLMIVGLRDQVAAADLALEAYNNALEPKQLVLLDGGHFDPYDVKFDEASTAAVDWFSAHLG